AVDIRVVSTSASAIMEIHNAGPAIPSELLPHIFDPFRRGARNGSARSGLGLGLYISEQIVVAHGGMIDVRSADEFGTTFRVILPSAASPPEVQPGPS